MSKLVHFSHLVISLKMLSHWEMGSCILSYSQKEPFPFPHYCGIGTLPGVAAAGQWDECPEVRSEWTEELFLSDMWPMWLHWHPEWSHLKTYHLLGLLNQHRGVCLLYMNEEVRLALCLWIASARGPFVPWQNP